GPIWCTPGTAQLAPVLLRDAAHLQEEDARYANRHGSSKHRPALPLYTDADAVAACGLLQPVPFGEPVKVARSVSASFSRAGHIVGAASVRLDDGQRTVLFSGDLGRRDDPIMLPPDPPP